MCVCVSIKKRQLSMCYLKYMEKKTHNVLKITNISLLFRSFINKKSDYKTKIQITKQYNKSTLKNTYRIK